MKFAHVLGVVNGVIILTLLFCTMVGIYALVRKVIALFSKGGEMPKSFWNTRRPRPATMEELRRQF
ncbi:MAG TPA: hypothetical protein VJI74_01255 [Candidatus Paceibacterota bacterium]